MLNRILNKFGYKLVSLKEIDELCETVINTTTPEPPINEFAEKYESALKIILQKEREINKKIHTRSDLEATLHNTLDLMRDTEETGIQIEYLPQRLKNLDSDLLEIDNIITTMGEEYKQMREEFKVLEQEIKDAGWMYDSHGAYYDDKNRWSKI